MKKNIRRIITIMMVLSLLLVNMSFANIAMAEETTDVSMVESETEEIITKEFTAENETGEETTEKKEANEEANEEATTNDNSKEKMTTEIETEKESKEEVTTDNRQEETEDDGEQNVTGIEVIGDNLPDYVEVRIEKADIEPFQEALNEYYNQWLAEQDVDSDDEYYEEKDDTDWDDEDYEDEDDSYNDDSGSEDNLDEEENTDNLYINYHGSNEVLSAYKISLINTNDGSEYEIPEGQSVEVKVSNEAYNNSAAGGVMRLDDNDTMEMLNYERIYDETSDEIDFDDTYDEEYEEENSEQVQDDDCDGDDNIDDVYKESISFNIVQSGTYAILNGLVAETSLDENSYGEEKTQNFSKVSPKTGANRSWFAGAVLAIILLVVSAWNYQKKKIAKVHKNY